MKSIRELVGCLKFSTVPFQGAWPDDISVLADFWGYTMHPSDGIINNAGTEGLSLLRQANLLAGRHIHLNVICVGDLLDARQQRITNALYKLRDIYAAANLGVGRIEHFDVPTDLADGYDVIDSDQESRDLTDEWTVHNDGMDLFIVNDSWTGEEGGNILGRSETDGSCDKDGGAGMTGSVVSLSGSVITGITMAHELGHYLGLEHIADLDSEEAGDLPSSPFFDLYRRNLMFPRVSRDALEILGTQAALMKEHCFVKSGC